MSQVQAADIAFTAIDLQHCSVDDHCAALIDTGLPFWWYQAPSRIFGQFSTPFRDDTGTWWYAARPGFCWPVAVHTEIERSRRRVAYRKSFIGFQHCVLDADASNSTLAINVILDLAAYGPGSLTQNRRRMVRTGAKRCDVTRVDRIDDAVVVGATKCWNDLVTRTGWKTHRTAAEISESLSRLLDHPAATILLARERKSGNVAGFLVTKVFGDTAYVDTIASDSELLSTNPNDILIYTFIRNAQRIPTVAKVHYAIKSRVEQLERFKTGIGFIPHPAPAYLHLRPGMSTALRLFARPSYDRLVGRFDEP